jgi:lysophospholipase L1-like esterase
VRVLRRVAAGLFAAAAGAGALAGCGASGPGGGVPIDRMPVASDVATSTAPGATTAPDAGAAGPDVTGPGPGTPETRAPGPPDPVVAAVDSVLGGQATISRPIGDDATRPDVHDDRVLVLGDSIAEAGGPQYHDTIRRQLAQLGWEATVDAVRGRTTPQGLDELERHRAEVHDVVVVLLGHNDATDAGAYRDHIEAIVDELSGVPLVLLLTNYAFETGRGRMNDELRVVAALHDNVELADWDAVVRATDGAIGPDGLHLTARGAEALAATIAVALGPAPDVAGAVGPGSSAP